MPKPGFFKHSEELKKRFSQTRQLSDNPNWKGDKVGYSALHARIRRHMPPPKDCQHCHQIKEKSLHLANISGKYLTTHDDWIYLCHQCHIKFDGLEKNLETNYKLTPEQVLQIRDQRGKQFARDLAAKYGVTPNYIRHLWIKSRWKDL